MGWSTLRALDKQFGLGLVFRKTPMQTVQFPGGGSIWFVGADKEDQIEKLRGNKYPEVCIDEAGFYRRSVLDKLVHEIITPALADYKGVLVLAGTPSYVANGFFYEACTDHIHEASVHHWTMLDNPHLADPQAEWDKRSRYYDGDTHPGFRREYKGEWVFEKGGLVYRGYDARTSAWDGKLDGDEKAWEYVLGIDYGFRPSPTAFALLAYDNQQPRIRVVKTFEKPHLIHTAVGVEVERLKKDYDIQRVVVDAAEPSLIEALNLKGGFHCEGSEKRNKMGFIQLLNDEFAMGVVRVNVKQCETFHEQATTLQLSDKSDYQKLIEDPRQDNHTTDAVLYAWRWCHRYYGNLTRERSPQSLAQELEDAMLAEALADYEAEKNQDWWDDGTKDNEWYTVDPYTSLW